MQLCMTVSAVSTFWKKRMKYYMQTVHIQGNLLKKIFPKTVEMKFAKKAIGIIH